MIKLMIFLSALLWIVPAQQKMVKTKVTDNITLMLPEDFYAMSPDDIAQRYPSVRKPIGAYTNSSRMVDFSVNESATRWREQDTPMAKDFFKASLLNLYDEVEMIQEGVRTINKRNYIYFEFDSTIEGDKYSLDKKNPVRTYTYIQYLIMNGKTLVFSFNCPYKFKDKWKEAAGEVMESIKVKKGA